MNIRVLMGLQTSKGVKAENYVQLYATDYSVTPDASVTNSEALSGSRFFQGQAFLARLNMSGDIPVEFTPDTLLWLVEHAGFKKEESAGDVIYKASDKVDKWLTIVCDYPGEEAYEEILDVKINSLTINLATEAFVTGTVNIIGCNMSFNTTAWPVADSNITTPKETQLICLDSSISLGSDDISASLSDATLTINNNLEGAASINSVYNTDIRESNADANIAITYNRFDKTVYKKGLDAVLANTSGEVTMKLGTKNSSKYITILVHKATPTENSPTDLSGFGGMTQSYSIAYDAEKKTPFTITGKGYGA